MGNVRRRNHPAPSATGITGLRDAVIRDTMVFDGLPNPRDVHSTKGGPGIHPGRVRDVDDVYDLVVVGAGASGLAAAKWYQDRFGADAKILLTVNLDSIGMSNQPQGGLLDIPGSYGQPAVDKRLGRVRVHAQRDQRGLRAVQDLPG